MKREMTVPMCLKKKEGIPSHTEREGNSRDMEEGQELPSENLLSWSVADHRENSKHSVISSSWS